MSLIIDFIIPLLVLFIRSYSFVMESFENLIICVGPFSIPNL